MERIDKDQLGQLIRMNAHFMEMFMKCDNREKELEDLSNKLTRCLEEWNNYGFTKGPDRIWAGEILEQYKTWVKNKEKVIPNTTREIEYKDIFDVIKSRRSIRFWKKQLVTKETISKIIEAGTYAPSSFNRMTWKFFVVENELENIVEGDSSNKSMIEKAPVRIYVAIDERLYGEEYAAAMDAALVSQNILLSAQALGLSACLIYQCEIIDQEKIKAMLNIPEYYKVYCAILLGYPDESPSVPGRVSVDDVISFIKVDYNLETFLK